MFNLTLTQFIYNIFIFNCPLAIFVFNCKLTVRNIKFLSCPLNAFASNSDYSALNNHVMV
jgi:hypothetical protein